MTDTVTDMLEDLQWCLEGTEIVEVWYYTKKGTERTMYCSRHLGNVSKDQHDGINDHRLNGPDIICVYDMDNRDWRAFRKDSVIDFKVV